MAGEKVRIKIRHDRHGVIYPRGAVVTLPSNVEFDPIVLHELIESAPKAEKPAPVEKPGKGKGKTKVETPPADDDDTDDSP